MCEKSSSLGEADCASPCSATMRRADTGSARLHSRADVPLVLDALLAMVRDSGFSDRDLFGIRFALEEAIHHGFEHHSGQARCRLRYHLSGDGLLLELDGVRSGIDTCCDKSVELMRHFMTEVRQHGHGLTLYKRRRS